MARSSRRPYCLAGDFPWLADLNEQGKIQCFAESLNFEW